MELTKVSGHKTPQGVAWNPSLEELLSPKLQVVNKKEQASGTLYAKAKDNYRKKVNIEEMYGVNLDIDKSPTDVLPMLVEALQGYQGYINTTFSHDPKHEKYCYRAFINSESPIKPEDYEAGFINLVNSNPILSELKEKGILDMSAKDVGRFFYDFSCPPSRENDAYFHSLGGIPLIPDTRKQVTNNNSSSRSEPLLVSPPPQTPRIVSQVKHALSQIPADCSYEIWRNVIWGLLSTGWSCSVELAMTWSKSTPALFNEVVFNTVVDNYDPTRNDSPTLGTIYYLAKKGGQV